MNFESELAPKHPTRAQMSEKTVELELRKEFYDNVQAATERKAEWTMNQLKSSYLAFINDISGSHSDSELDKVS